jgi:hypothetical protein
MLKGLATVYKPKERYTRFTPLWMGVVAEDLQLDQGSLETDSGQPDRRPSHSRDHRWEEHGIKDWLSQHP